MLLYFTFQTSVTSCRRLIFSESVWCKVKLYVWYIGLARAAPLDGPEFHREPYPILWSRNQRKQPRRQLRAFEDQQLMVSFLNCTIHWTFHYCSWICRTNCARTWTAYRLPPDHSFRNCGMHLPLLILILLSVFLGQCQRVVCCRTNNQKYVQWVTTALWFRMPLIRRNSHYPISVRTCSRLCLFLRM